MLVANEYFIIRYKLQIYYFKLELKKIIDVEIRFLNVKFFLIQFY